MSAPPQKPACHGGISDRPIQICGVGRILFCGPHKGDHYFGEVCYYRRQAPDGRSRYIRRKECGGGHPARHHPGRRCLRHREPAQYQRCVRQPEHPQRPGRPGADAEPEHLRDRHHPSGEHQRAGRPVPPDARQLLFPGGAAVPVRPGTGGHAGGLQSGPPSHRPAPEGVQRPGRTGQRGLRHDHRPRQGKAAGRPHLL